MIDATDRVIISTLNGNAERGGWECSGTVLLDTSLLERWSLVEIWLHPALNAPPGPPTRAFKGYVYRYSADVDATRSAVSFDAATSHAILERGWLQGIGFVDVEHQGRQRAHYHQFDARDRMTLGKIIRHILGYYDEVGQPPSTNPDWVAHTNLVHHPIENPGGWITLDFVETAGSAEVSRYIVRESTNLWRTLRDIAGNEFYTLYFDRHDRLHYHPHPVFYGTPPTPSLELTERMHVGDLSVEIRESRVRQVLLHAVTDAETTLHASYPTSPTHVYGEVEERTGIRCNSQSLLNTFAQRLYRWVNRPYTLTWRAPGPLGAFVEIGEPVYVTWSGVTRGVHWDFDRTVAWISDVRVEFAEGNTSTTTLTLEVVA